MPFLALRDVTAGTNSSKDGMPEIGLSSVHRKGSVLSDRDVSDHIKERIKAGDPWARLSFEPLTESDARKHRIRATTAEGPRSDGTVLVAPPWEDYVGLHPVEIIGRLQDATIVRAEQVRAYERAGLNRQEISEYSAPAEREPFVDYNDLSVREVLGKLDMIGTEEVQHVIAYEVAHRARPAIVTYVQDEAQVDSDVESTGELILS